MQTTIQVPPTTSTFTILILSICLRLHALEETTPSSKSGVILQKKACFRTSFPKQKRDSALISTNIILAICLCIVARGKKRHCCSIKKRSNPYEMLVSMQFFSARFSFHDNYPPNMPPRRRPRKACRPTYGCRINGRNAQKTTDRISRCFLPYLSSLYVSLT